MTEDDLNRLRKECEERTDELMQKPEFINSCNSAALTINHFIQSGPSGELREISGTEEAAAIGYASGVARRKQLTGK